MLRFEIRLFDLETGEAIGADQHQDMRYLKNWGAVIEKCREGVWKRILENRLLKAKLIFFGELWESPNGFGHQTLPVKIWEADVIDPKNPRGGYKEQIFIKLSDEEMEELGFVVQEQPPISQRLVENKPKALSE